MLSGYQGCRVGSRRCCSWGSLDHGFDLEQASSGRSLSRVLGWSVRRGSFGRRWGGDLEDLEDLGLKSCWSAGPRLAVAWDGRNCPCWVGSGDCGCRCRRLGSGCSFGHPLPMAFEVAEGRGSSYCFVNWLSLCVEVLPGSHLCPEVGEMVQGNRLDRSQCLMHYPSMEHSIQSFDRIRQKIP